MTQLQLLRTHDEREIKIIREVAGMWEWMAGRLGLSDTEVIIIQRNHPNDVESACTDMFRRWLAGRGQPVTWQTLINSLRELHLNVVASRLEDILLH